MKKYLLLAILLLAMLAIIPMISLVSATQTMSTPVAYGNYTGTVTITVTTTTGGTDHNVSNVTCFYNESAGAADRSTALIEIINASADQLIFTGSATISSLTDATLYNISCELWNFTQLNDTLFAAGVTFDSTDPVCTFKKDHRTMPWKGVQQVEWTSTDALSLIGSRIVIDRPEDGADMTYTNANRELTLTSQDTKYIGDWSATLGAIDRAANVCNESLTWKTYLPDGVGWEEWDGEEPAGIPWLIIAVIVLIGYFILKKK